MNRLRCLILMAVCLLIGVLLGYLPSRASVNKYRDENAVLTADLQRAIVRGVAAETQLNLCREGKK